MVMGKPYFQLTNLILNKPVKKKPSQIQEVAGLGDGQEKISHGKRDITFGMGWLKFVKKEVSLIRTSGGQR